jgi:hypothetical protein
VALDSVLFTVALLQGYEALHAGAIATAAGAVAITAGTGGGKSTLLSELLRRGLTLLADDVLALESVGEDEPPLAHPAPPLMSLPSARLAPLRATDSAARKSLETVLALDEELWVAVPVHPEPLTLRALVVLHRRPGLTTVMRRSTTPFPALLDGLMRFPRTRERERTRFELAGTIAAHVPIWKLEADPRVSPATLADVLVEELSERPTADASAGSFAPGPLAPV